jgi:hypothetical protein
VMFRISEHTRVFSTFNVGYDGLKKFIVEVFLEKEIGLALLLLMLSFIKIAMHQPCTDSMSD